MTAANSIFGWLSAILIAEYLQDLQDRGAKQKTIKWYMWHLHRATDWFVQQPEFHALSILDAAALQMYYRSTGNLADSSRRNMVAMFKAFGSWLRRYGMDDPAAYLQRPRRDKRLPKVLSPSELARLLRVIEGESLRDRALVLLFVDSGIRVSEAANLRREDVDVAAGQLIVRDGKGNKDRVVYFFDRCIRALSDYLASHDHEYVFVSEHIGPPPVRKQMPPKRMTDNGIRQILRRMARRHGFSDLRPHTLRRTCGTEMSVNGVDPFSIADQLGHEDITTTRIYARLGDERRREVLRRGSPVDKSSLGHLQFSLPGFPDFPGG